MVINTDEKLHNNNNSDKLRELLMMLTAELNRWLAKAIKNKKNGEVCLEGGHLHNKHMFRNS